MNTAAVFIRHCCQEQIHYVAAGERRGALSGDDNMYGIIFSRVVCKPNLCIFVISLDHTE